MRKGELRVLMIGTDYSAATASVEMGYLRQRLVDYGRHVTSLTCIVKCPGHLRLRPVDLSDRVRVIPVNSRNRIAFLVGAWRLGTALIRERAIDVIVTQDPFYTGVIGLMLKRRWGLGLSVLITSDFFGNPAWLNRNRLHRVLHWLGLWVLRGTDVVRVLAIEQREKLLQLGLKPETVKVTPWHFPLEPFFSSEGNRVRDELLSGCFESIVLYAGRLSPEKGVKILLDAAQEVVGRNPKTLLVILGSGGEEASLRDQAARLGISTNVRFVPGVPHSEVPEYMSAADVFVLPSYYEALSGVRMEAAACGKPVVSSRAGYIADSMIEGVTGLVFEAGDRDGLTRQILFLLDNPEKAREMGRMGREFIKCHAVSSEKASEAIVQTWYVAAGRGRS